MSSLAATQADGYYLPPEYFESGLYKRKSKNQFAGSNGHNQYLQKGVVRFELPYKGICGKCLESIARGTRFNAHKHTTEETYFSTPILEFQLSCRKCQHPWRIRTNPKERGFDYVEGITIQAGQEDVVQQPSSSVEDMTSSQGIIVTNLDRLESVARGQRSSITEIERLQAIQQLNSKTTLEDADLNAVIRKGFRGDRKLNLVKRQQAAKIGWREGMQWLNSSLDDQVAAKTTVYGKAHDTEKRHFGKVRKSSIFGKHSRKETKRKRHSAPAEPTLSAQIQASWDGPTGQLLGEDQKLLPSGPKTKQKIQVSVLAARGKSNVTTVSVALGVCPSDPLQPPSGLNDMLAGYGSSGSED
jgi:coiled-coil domain-containing protein 130